MTPTECRSFAQLAKFCCDNAVVLRLNLADIQAFSSLGIRAAQEADSVEAKAVEAQKVKEKADA